MHAMAGFAPSSNDDHSFGRCRCFAVNHFSLASCNSKYGPFGGFFFERCFMQNSIVVFPFRPPSEQSKNLRIFIGIFLQGLKPLGHVFFNSGAPVKQPLTAISNQVRMEGHPCPEGDYDLGPLVWANPKDHTVLHQLVQSPYWVDVYRGRDIGIHRDGNRLWFPGSAGCWVPVSDKEEKSFLALWARSGGFHKIYVIHFLNYSKIDRQLKIHAYNYYYSLRNFKGEIG